MQLRFTKKCFNYMCKYKIFLHKYKFINHPFSKPALFIKFSNASRKRNVQFFISGNIMRKHWQCLYTYKLSFFYYCWKSHTPFIHLLKWTTNPISNLFLEHSSFYISPKIIYYIYIFQFIWPIAQHK